MSSFNDNYDVLAIGVSTTIGPDQKWVSFGGIIIEDNSC